MFLCILSRVLDNCKKLGLVFENVVGIVEIINSKSVQLQVRKRLLLELRLPWMQTATAVALTGKYFTQLNEVDPESQL